MVPSRHKIPVPPWAELPTTDATGGETFRPFVTGAFARRTAAPSGAAPFSSLSETLSIVRDEDGDAPRTSLD
jgi:hypothetical protein